LLERPEGAEVARAALLAPRACHMVLLRQEPKRETALERSVVLEASGIGHELEPLPDGRFALLVADQDAARAEAALAAWEAENVPPAPPARADYGRSLAGPAAGLAIVLFALQSGLGTGRRLVEAGGGDASRFLAGEWWRAATSLTLHADLAHLAANAVAVSIFLGAVARRLGPALAVWLALAAGVGGNALTALVARSSHVSIGASTAVFGSLGTLCALAVPGRRTWLTLGVGVALLGLLGTGARADLLAHLLGFAVGVAEGLALRRSSPPPRSNAQPLIALLAVAPVALAWWRALVSPLR
jgi:rhomboid protease GluP